jgi:3-hydroxybutyryl-CoA dehydrogenase
MAVAQQRPSTGVDHLAAIGHVAVVGGGVMGNGIAQVIAQAGLRVTVVDISEEALERSLARIGRSLDRFVSSGRLDETAARAAQDRIDTTTDLEVAGGSADHVVETVVEDFAVKRDVLRASTQCAATTSSSRRTRRSSRSPRSRRRPRARIGSSARTGSTRPP